MRAIVEHPPFFTATLEAVAVLLFAVAALGVAVACGAL